MKVQSCSNKDEFYRSKQRILPLAPEYVCMCHVSGRYVRYVKCHYNYNAILNVARRPIDIFPSTDASQNRQMNGRQHCRIFYLNAKCCPLKNTNGKEYFHFCLNKPKTGCDSTKNCG